MDCEVKPHIKLTLPETKAGSPRVLLHACCAPCSSAIVECLLDNGLRPTVFYSNSNITPREEYLKRLEECRRYAAECGIDLIEDSYDHEGWLSIAKGLEKEPERGGRCLQCFRYRLERAARYAHENGFGVLATTLASSRWKSLEQVDAAGEFACSLFPDVVWWKMNWRKGGLQERRNYLIKEKQFYNQLWCGCEFSRRTEKESISGGR